MAAEAVEADAMEEVEVTTVVKLVAATWTLLAMIATVAESGSGATTSTMISCEDGGGSEDCGTSGGSEDGNGRGQGDLGGMFGVGVRGCVSDGTRTTQALVVIALAARVVVVMVAE